MNILALDGGANTGWAIVDTSRETIANAPRTSMHGVNLCCKYVASGCIYAGRARGNRFAFLQHKLRDLYDLYDPKRAFIEKLYSYKLMRGGKYLSRGLQIYSAFWHTAFSEVTAWGIECIEIDTTRIIKKNMAIRAAMPIINKTQITTHEAEALMFALYATKQYIKKGE
jgi:hypothetical protein